MYALVDGCAIDTSVYMRLDSWKVASIGRIVKAMEYNDTEETVFNHCVCRLSFPSRHCYKRPTDNSKTGRKEKERHKKKTTISNWPTIPVFVGAFDNYRNTSAAWSNAAH